MNPKLQIIIFSIALCIFTYIFVNFILHFLLPILDVWTIKNYQKQLLIQFQTFDLMLLRFFPLLIGTFLITSNVSSFKIALRIQLIVLFSVILCLIIGYTVAFLFWTNKLAFSPLMPEYLKYQPFAFYWTTFIIAAIVIPLYIQIRKLHR